MHSYIISGGSFEERNNLITKFCGEWNIALSDSIHITVQEDKSSIGIDDIRLLTHTLSLSPRYSPYVIGVIDHAESLTEEAQNALLKTLEEPPPKARIFLSTPTYSSLLPTIISRCQMIQTALRVTLSESKRNEIIEMILSLQSKSPGEIIHSMEQYIDKKDKGVHFFETLLFALHDMLHLELQEKAHHPAHTMNGQKLHALIRNTIQAQKLLSAHVRTELVFDNYFLPEPLLDKA